MGIGIAVYEGAVSMYDLTGSLYLGRGTCYDHI